MTKASNRSRRVFAAIMFVVALLPPAACLAQAVPAPASSAPAATSAGEISQIRPSRTDTLTVAVPQQYEVKLSGLPGPGGGPGWLGSAVIAAVVAGIASVLSAMKTAAISAEARQSLETQLQSERLEHERDMKSRTEAFQRELDALTREHQTKSQQATLSREDQKIDNEVARLRHAALTSDFETELAAIRLVRERESEAAKLIHTFLPQLTGESDRDRQLALFALSEYVDIDALKRVLAEKASEAVSPSAPPGKGATDA
ncbi:hypothetical protein EGT07_02170 [Herbaspirillum sp. HC18]|nr:hypothetical protein EGT07_02170 [Herbaspirillum sp. HC18]